MSTLLATAVATRRRAALILHQQAQLLQLLVPSTAPAARFLPPLPPITASGVCGVGVGSIAVDSQWVAPSYHHRHQQQQQHGRAFSASAAPKKDNEEEDKDKDKDKQQQEDEQGGNNDDKDDDDDDDDNSAMTEHNAHAFALHGGTMRANLEAWLVAACLDGTGTNGNDGPRGTSTTTTAAGGCAFLPLAPRPQFPPAVWAARLLSSATSPLRRALQRRGEALTRAAIDAEFDAQEFCDEAGRAFEQVMMLYGQGQWRVLEKMASPAVIASMRRTWDDLQARRGLEPVSINAKAVRASLSAPNVWRRAAVARLDEGRASAPLSEGGPTGAVPWWFTAAVELEAEVEVVLAPAGWRGDDDVTEEEEKEGEEEEEEEEEEVESPAPQRAPPPGAPLQLSRTRRVGYLVFARGPLPRSVAPALYTPYWLIGWY